MSVLSIYGLLIHEALGWKFGGGGGVIVLMHCSKLVLCGNVAVSSTVISI